MSICVTRNSTGTIATSVAACVTANGGQCLVDHRVAEIIVSDGAAVGVKVESNGRQNGDLEFTAPRIVSDAGAFTTFCDLLPQSVPIPFRADLERISAGHGFVTLYLAFKESPATLGFRGENHWSRPRRTADGVLPVLSVPQGPSGDGAHRGDHRVPRLRVSCGLEKSALAQPR
jgi:phytoene dehydrogenase-like protein